MSEIFECSEKKIAKGRIRLTFVKLQEESISERSVMWKGFTFRDGKSKFIWFKNKSPFNSYKVGDRFEIDLEKLRSFHFSSNVGEEVMAKKNEVVEAMEVDMNENEMMEEDSLEESSSFQEDLVKFIKENNADGAKEIIGHYPDTVTFPDKNKNYALHYAVADGNEELTNALLEVKEINVRKIIKKLWNRF